MFKTETIKGYDQLTGKNKKVFDKFLKDFHNAWEFPEERKPVSVKIEKGYLRADFLDGSWLHVKANGEWY